jgi:hypothetical protein
MYSGYILSLPLTLALINMSQPKKTATRPTSQPKTTITHTISHSTTTTTQPKPEEKTDYTGLFNALFPIALFFLGYIVNRWLDNKKEKDRLKDIEEYLYRVLPDLTTAIDEQVTEINTIIEGLKITTDLSGLRIPEIPTLRSSKVRGISDTDLFKIYVSNRKVSREQAIDDYRQVTSSADYIDLTIPIIHTISQNNINNAKIFAQAFEAPLNTIGAYSFELLNKANSNPPDMQAKAVLNLLDPRIEALKRTGSFLNAKGSKDINECILKPLKAHFAQISLSGYLADIAIQIKAAADEYNGLENYKSDTATALTEISTKLNLYSVNLKSITQRYNKV